MISKTAIDEFLNRKLQSWDFMKQWTDTEIDIALSQLDPPPYFATKPMFHQKICFLLGTQLPELVLLTDLGLGKTKICLDMLSYYKQCGLEFEALVVVPNLVLIDSWEIECKKHAPNLDVVPLRGHQEERLITLLENKGDLYIINYQGLVTLTCTLEMQTRVKPGKQPRKQYILDKPMCKKFASKFKFVILDESTEVKNHDTIYYKVCKEVMKQTTGRFALTGTPFGRHADDLWSQFYLIDRGKTLGSTLGIFRESFFDIKPGYWGGTNYKLKKHLETKLHQVLKHRSLRFAEEECIKLPPKIYTDIKLSFPTDAITYYNRVVAQIRAAKGNITMITNSFVALRQLTSGFITYTDDLTGEKIKLDFKPNPKLEALQEIVQRMPENKKMLIFHEYVYSGQMISNMLTKLKVKHLRLFGGTKDKGLVLNQFTDDPSYKILVVNQDTGDKGLNLQCSNYIAYFESPVDPITRVQTEKRAHRNGQEQTVFIYDLIIKRSIDEKIKTYLNQGKDLFASIIDGKEQLDLYD